MDIQVIEKKLREARFFLWQMREHERLASEDTEPFDFYLSAFLTAAMSVRGAFHYERDRERSEAVKAWKQRWETGLSSGKARLYHFMRRDRAAEIRRGGSGCDTTEYNFTIDGTERRATEACGEYLALLEEMLAKFVTRHAEDTIDQLIAAARSNLTSRLTSVERGWDNLSQEFNPLATDAGRVEDQASDIGTRSSQTRDESSVRQMDAEPAQILIAQAPNIAPPINPR